MPKYTSEGYDTFKIASNFVDKPGLKVLLRQYPKGEGFGLLMYILFLMVKDTEVWQKAEMSDYTNIGILFEMDAVRVKEIVDWIKKNTDLLEHRPYFGTPYLHSVPLEEMMIPEKIKKKMARTRHLQLKRKVKHGAELKERRVARKENIIVKKSALSDFILTPEMEEYCLQAFPQINIYGETVSELFRSFKMHLEGKWEALIQHGIQPTQETYHKFFYDYLDRQFKKKEE